MEWGCQKWKAYTRLQFRFQKQSILNMDFFFRSHYKHQSSMNYVSSDASYGCHQYSSKNRFGNNQVFGICISVGI